MNLNMIKIYTWKVRVWEFVMTPPGFFNDSIPGVTARTTGGTQKCSSGPT